MRAQATPRASNWLDHHLHQMVFEKLRLDDYRRKFDPDSKALNELPDPLDPNRLDVSRPCGSFVGGARDPKHNRSFAL